MVEPILENINFELSKDTISKESKSLFENITDTLITQSKLIKDMTEEAAKAFEERDIARGTPNNMMKEKYDLEIRLQKVEQECDVKNDQLNK